MIEETYIDGEGTEFKVGDRVIDFVCENVEGTVIRVSDPDGDVDDDGRPICITPRATVRFDDGTEEDYISYWTSKGPWDDDAPWQFDDLEVAKEA